MTHKMPTLSRRAALKVLGAGSVVVAAPGLALIPIQASAMTQAGGRRCANCRDLWFSGPCPGQWCVTERASRN